MTPEWFQKQTIEHLKAIRASRRPGMPEYQMADDAIQEKEKEQANQRRDQIESQRHQELLSSQENRHPNSDSYSWKKKIAVGIIISASGGFLVLMLKYLLGL